jgi:hypothetical protein
LKEMFKGFFKRFKKEEQLNSPVARDTLRRLSGVPDDSATGRAIQSTEVIMARAMDVVGNDLLNENDATKEASIYFMAGVAIGYCHRYGIEDPGDIRAVVRCSMRQWAKNPAAADHLADNLQVHLEDDDFAGAVIDSAGEAVCTPSYGPEEVAAAFGRTLKKWRTFDLDAHYAKLESASNA